MQILTPSVFGQGERFSFCLSIRRGVLWSAVIMRSSAIQRLWCARAHGVSRGVYHLIGGALNDVIKKLIKKRGLRRRRNNHDFRHGLALDNNLLRLRNWIVPESFGVAPATVFVPPLAAVINPDAVPVVPNAYVILPG